MNAQDSGSETHVYTAEGSRADTPAAAAAAAADFRVQFADLPNRCVADDPEPESVPRQRVDGTARAILKTREITRKMWCAHVDRSRNVRADT